MDEKEARLLMYAERTQKEIKRLENEIKVKTVRMQEAKRKLKDSRNVARTHKGMTIFGDIVNLLGFKEEEANCVTVADYEELRKKMIATVSELQKLKKDITKVPVHAPEQE